MTTLISESGTKKLTLNTKTGKNNISNSKKAPGLTTNNNKDMLKEEEIDEIFHGRRPKDLKIKSNKPALTQSEKKDIKDTKTDDSKTIGNTKLNDPLEKKDESGTNIFSEISDDDAKQNVKEKTTSKKVYTEEELDQKIYIMLNETDTQILYFSPSIKIPSNKIPTEEERNEKRNEDIYNDYLQKLKNSERFLTNGSQTLNPYKRNQIISTLEAYENTGYQNQNSFVSALNWQIEDAKKEEKNKKDDELKILQKKFDKKVQKELKSKLQQGEYNADINQSYSLNKSINQSETYSMTDTKLSTSLHGVKKPRPSRTIQSEDGQQSFSMTKSRKIDSSPNNSSTFLNITKGVGQSSDNDTSLSRIGLAETRIKKSLDEAIPSTLNNPLKYVERLLAQNQYHFMQIAYKNYPIDEDELKNKDLSELDFDDNEEKKRKEEQRMKEIELVLNKSVHPDMKFLFSFKGDILFKNQKYVVNCLDWNPHNPDLLAAAYGPQEIDSKNEGLLLFWTLKNQYPERVIKTPKGLTYCNFSTKNPYYIVVSDYIGEIKVYDLRNNSDIPIADSKEVKEKHTDIVWEAKWVERPNDKNEMIVSISSDGKVKEWLLKKGLEVSDLMNMKKNTSFPDKTLNPFSKYDQQNKDSLIFREANGLSFDFPVNDTTIYYISLEECTVNKCRISYKDTYIETYYGHQGPVYKVRCNPFDPNIFLTCSYDWTIKIWNTKNFKPILTCKSMNKSSQINDIEWSPFTSTIFACVIDDGAIEIWDLAKQTTDPIIVFPSKTGDVVSRRTIKFSRSSQVIATGDSEFNIDIFRLYNLEHSIVSDQAQIKRLEMVLTQNSEQAGK